MSGIHGIRQPIGTISFRQRSGQAPVPFIKVSMDGPRAVDNWKPWARWYWEQNHGVVPEGKRVVFLDGNPENMVPDNVGLATPGDVFFIAGERDPEMVERNRIACREGTIRANIERGARRRARRWLPTRWYAVIGSTIVNRPTKSRCDLIRLFGGNPPRNGLITCELPFVAVKGNEIESRFGKLRRLPRPPKAVCQQVASLLPRSTVIAPNPTGLCQCGCGEMTERATSTRKDVSVGQYQRFILGHWPNWVRKNVDSEFGCKAHAKAHRIAEEVARELSPLNWIDVLGPAFEAARRCSTLKAMRLAAAKAVKRHHYDRQYCASVDYLASKGIEIVDRRVMEGGAV